MTIDLTQIVIYIIGLVFALISAFLVPYIKTKLSAEQFKKLQDYVKIAVEAAEMIYKGPGRGEEKKIYVQTFLAEKGYNIDLTEVENAIEAAVLEMNKNLDN